MRPSARVKKKRGGEGKEGVSALLVIKELRSENADGVCGGRTKDFHKGCLDFNRIHKRVKLHYQTGILKFIELKRAALCVIL